MSAFVVRDATINRILSFLTNWQSREWSQQQFAKIVNFGHQHPEFNQKVGAALVALNQDAVNQRYSENDPVPDYTFKFELVELPQALRSLRCLIYPYWYASNSIPDFEDEANVPGTELAEALEFGLEALRIVNERS